MPGTARTASLVRRGLSALGAGTIFGAIGAGYLVTSLYASKIAARLGRQVLAVGGLCITGGVAGPAGAVAAFGIA